MNILIVDDEQMILDLVVRILKRGNFQAMTTTSGQDAITIFEQNKDNIDLVMLDHNLPGISGVEILSTFRDIKPDIPCLYSSGEVNIIDKIPDELINNTYILVKPYRALSLLEMVEQIDQQKNQK